MWLSLYKPLPRNSVRAGFPNVLPQISGNIPQITRYLCLAHLSVPDFYTKTSPQSDCDIGRDSIAEALRLCVGIDCAGLRVASSITRMRMVHDVRHVQSRKLRLDTRVTSRGAPDRPVAYNLRTNSSHLEPQSNYGSYAAHVSSELSSTDLLGTLFSTPGREEGDGQDGAQQGHDQADDEGDSCSQAADSLAVRHVTDSRRPSRVSVPHVDGRERASSSVSFSAHATLDDGMRHSIGEPLPKPGSVRRRTRAPSVRGDSHGLGITPTTPSESPRMNPFTGEPARRRTRRSDVSPRAESAHDGYGVPSLASGSTASPPLEVINTPLSLSVTGSMLSSPAVVSSPVFSPSEPWPMSRHGSLSARACSRKESLRNSSRRSSRMSASSPASAFLGKWGKESLASITPDPGEEGQAIGLNNEYVIGRQVGYGGFSVVKELHGIAENGDRIRLTVKIVRKNIPDVSDAENEKQQQAIEHEVDVWRFLQNEHILPLHAVYDTDYATFCVMDLVEGGTLFDLIRKSRKSATKGLGEQLAKHYSYQLASALRYLHKDIRLVHRDVKLENCLLDMGGPEADLSDSKLRLCDFGLADFFTSDMYDSIELLDLNEPDERLATDIVGTLQYAAPEAFTSTRQVLHPSVDIWAFGVCLYAMLTGDLPFNHTLQSKVSQKIMKGSWNKDTVRSALASIPDNVADQVIDVLEGCLEVDSTMRWTISDVMECSWYADMHEENAGDGWQIVS